jgi:hypothetical protein
MATKIFFRPENESAQKYYILWLLVVFIRHGSAEIWGFQYGVTLGLGTLEIEASTGVFVLVVCALKRSISCGPSKPSTILNQEA